MTASCRDEVLGILRNFIGNDEVNDETCLYHDLRISGDDAYELLEDLNKAFGTSFKTMDFHKYFPAEGEDWGAGFLRLLGFRSKFERLTVAHLLSVVESGRWRNP